MDEATEGRLALYDELLDLVPLDLHDEQGEVFYSGRTAFEQQTPVYLLGYNPGGDPARLPGYTIGADLTIARDPVRRDWSGYADDSWKVFGPGAENFQRRVLHLMRESQLGDPRRIPTSNLIFLRSTRIATLDSARRDALLRSCWGVHQKVIEALGVRVVICLGQDTGTWVKRQLGAGTEIDRFDETYANRHWPSTTHLGRNGIQVVTLTHPSVADWTSPRADPTSLVTNALARDVASDFPAAALDTVHHGKQHWTAQNPAASCPRCNMELPATGSCGYCD